MARVWERTFSISVPVERAWRAFTHPDEIGVLFTSPVEGTTDPRDGLRVLEADRHRRLRWAAERADLPERAEFTVTFESSANGTRITMTRCGFGEGEDAEVFSEANALGWEHGMHDLVAYLETGRVLKRHYDACGLSCTGMVYRDADAGLHVLRVLPGTFADQAGLRRGDVVVRLAGVPVYRRSDLWTLLSVLPAGTDADVQVIRDGEVVDASAALSPLRMRAVGE